MATSNTFAHIKASSITYEIKRLDQGHNTVALVRIRPGTLRCYVLRFCHCSIVHKIKLG